MVRHIYTRCNLNDAHFRKDERVTEFFLIYVWGHFPQNHLEFEKLAVTSKPFHRSSPNFKARLILWSQLFHETGNDVEKIPRWRRPPSSISKNGSNRFTIRHQILRKGWLLCSSFPVDRKWCGDNIQDGDRSPSWISENVFNFQTISLICTKFWGKTEF